MGNITAGGTGKTPLVIKIVKQLEKKVPPAVILRGYGRKSRGTLVVNRKSSLSDAGDEALMLKRNLPAVTVITDKNRCRGAEKARDMGAGVAVLDDGFQSWEIKKDLNLVLIDSSRPFGGRRLIPLGKLREPLSSLKRSHAIVFTRCRGENLKNLDSIKKKISFYAPGTPLFISREKIKDFYGIHNRKIYPSRSLRGEKLICFSAIGNSFSFHSLLEEGGWQIVEKKIKRDHYKWKEGEVEALARKAREGKFLLVTTEKDAVKLPSPLKFKCFSLRIETVMEDEKRWEKLIYENVL